VTKRSRADWWVSDSQTLAGGFRAPHPDYINDGVYGSFNCILFDHQIVHPYPLTLSHSHPSTHSRCIPRHPGPPTPPNVNLPTDLPVMMGYTATERASVWGPTCDSIDCVRDVVRLPKGLEVGDWLGWGEMGAYTMCAASNFNG
jgi:ornithine decarboxylase